MQSWAAKRLRGHPRAQKNHRYGWFVVYNIVLRKA